MYHPQIQSTPPHNPPRPATPLPHAPSWSRRGLSRRFGRRFLSRRSPRYTSRAALQTPLCLLEPVPSTVSSLHRAPSSGGPSARPVSPTQPGLRSPLGGAMHLPGLPELRRRPGSPPTRIPRPQTARSPALPRFPRVPAPRGGLTVSHGSHGVRGGGGAS